MTYPAPGINTTRNAKVSVFSADRLAPLLRALADPEGTGLAHEDADVVERVERNLATDRCAKVWWVR